MNIAFKTRGKGETSLLIEQSAKTGQRIITSTVRSAKYVQNLAKKQGKEIPCPIDIKHYIENDKNKYNDKGVLLDEGDICLKVLLGCEVGCMTLTMDEI